MKKTTVVLAPFALFALLAPMTSAGIIAHWSYDEASGTTVADSSGNGWNGTAGPGVTLGSSGVFGNHGTFATGNGGIDVGTMGAASGGSGINSGDYSWASWVTSSNIGAQQRLLADWNASVQTFAIQLHASKLRISARNSDDTSIINNYVSANLSSDTLYHMAITFDYSTGTANTYIDGVSTGITLNGLANTDIRNTNNQWELGNAESAELQGTMDETWVFDQVLTPTEVNNLMVYNHIIPEPGTLGLLAFSGIAIFLRRKK